MRRDLLRSFLLAAACACALPFAHAGGPLYIDEATLRPVAWPNNVPVKVYTDLGSLGTMSNEAADALVVEAFRQWTNVDTSSFSATVAGDLASIGLPDITVDNAKTLFGAKNGGGVHVVYDHDGRLMADIWGVDYTVLGMASPEWGDGEVVTEGWMVLNGSSVTTFGATAEQFAGVLTHEAGHAIGLAHSQTNGAAVMFRDATGPHACKVPYADVAPTASIETMYPVISLWSTAKHVATVDARDDRVSLSNLYPGPGWSTTGSRITGRLLMPDGTTQLSGVNIIARNVADPFNDVVSVLSGDQTQGVAGPDGRFSINGLTPGAQYVLYADTIVRGGFSTYPAFLLYGRMSEEFWNTGESGDADADPRCTSSTLLVSADTATTASIVLNTPANEHLMRVIPTSAFEVTDVSADGNVLVGFRYLPNEQFTRAGVWTEAGGLQPVPGSLITGGIPKVTDDGTTVFTNFDEGDGVTYIGKWRVGDAAAERLTGGPLKPTACGVHGPSVYDISAKGDVVVGSAWKGCSGLAFKWTQSTGFQSMGGIGPYTRANAVSDDGLTVAGWNDSHAVFQSRQGTYWYRGRQAFASPAPASATQRWGEAMEMSPDGKVIVGWRGSDKMPWRLLRDTGERTLLPRIEVPGANPNSLVGLASTVSDDGTIIFGMWVEMMARRVFMWTETLGIVDLAEFLYAQGVDHARDIAIGDIVAITPDNHTLVGWGTTNGGVRGSLVSFTSRLDNVAVCTPDKQTQYVAFPRGLEQAVRDGARAGRCDRLAM